MRLFLALLLILRAGAACADGSVVTGTYTISFNGKTYRAVDDECVYYVDLDAHNAAHPGVALPDVKKGITGNYDANAIPDPVIVELADFVDCTQTGHNLQDSNICAYAAHPNKPSRVLTISGRQFRVTAAPDDGFATYFYSYDIATGGQAGVPNLLIAESSNDQERYTTLTIHHPDDIIYGPALPWAPPYTYKPESPGTLEPTINPWGDPWYSVNPERTQEGPVFGCDVGLATYSGREIPTDNLPFNIKMIFYPKTTSTRVVVSSLGCYQSRGVNDGGAVSRMWVFAFANPVSNSYPALTLPAATGKQRRIGVYTTHPWYFYAHYGTPVRLPAQRQEGLRRMVQDLKLCGFDYIVFNAVNGSDRTGKAWYPGSSYFPWNSAGNLLSELPPIAQSEGVQLVPLITSLQNPSGMTAASYQIGTNGSTTTAFGDPTLDPLRPEVQQVIFNLLSEIASRCGSNPSVRGIGIRANGKIGTCYTSRNDGTRGAKLSGYSSWDLQQFKNDTGSAVPVSPPQTAYNWLQARPAEWESWINWRCQRTRAFWLACRNLIRTYRSDLIFYVQCDLPSETPSTNIEWPAENPRNLLRYHGYDPDMFASDTGIVISRGMMVAEDRFYTRQRWGDPWGTNSNNYKAFHYAPGLAEMYRTGEGKACEFYQNYWEENQNAYWEFGSCGPSGVFFGTATPAAMGRYFFEGATMSLRRQDPDTMTWLGWNRPTLGHESDLRKFAQAFRALPAVPSVAFAGTISPAIEQVVARWYDDRLAVINDTNTARVIALQFAAPVPAGEELIDVVTGRKLVSATQSERQNVSFSAEAFSLNTFLSVKPTGPHADFTTDPLPTGSPFTVQFHDASVATGITGWDWDFGDATANGIGANPSHTYSGPGIYNVVLTVTSSDGTLTASRQITLVSVPPTVAAVSPARGASVVAPRTISVTFSKPVVGVAAANLSVNASAATSVSGSGAGPYEFAGFTRPSPGTASVVLGAGAIHTPGGEAFAGDSWTYTVIPAPGTTVTNPSFEDSGGSYNGWSISHVDGEWPDNPPLNNGNPWGVVTAYGTHFGGKITNGLTLNFYLGQVIGVTDPDPSAFQADWQLGSMVQMRATVDTTNVPNGVHQVWEIGWNNDGSLPSGIMGCDNYQTVAAFTGAYTSNDYGFHQFSVTGTIRDIQARAWTSGLQGVVIRVHMYNDASYWWTFDNIDNVSFTITPRQGISVAQAKLLADNSAVTVTAKPATAALGTAFYVEDADRTSGIRAVKSGEPITVGLNTDISGTIQTNADGERYIDASDVVQYPGAVVRALAASNRAQGGADFAYSPATGAGQQGISGAAGLNNIGLLMTTFGTVTRVGTGYLYIDDGSNLSDGVAGGAPGVKVVCDSSAYAPGDFVVVTGIVSCFRTPSGATARQILTRTPADVGKADPVTMSH